MLNMLIKRIGLPKKILLGYIGVLIFMAGEGLEQSWLSDFIIRRGLTVEESGLMFSVYGFAVAIAAWLSGVLAEMFTAKKVMAAGVVIFLIGSVLFLSLGLPSNNLSIMIPTYALRGLGYPLFSYGFLVWIAYEAPRAKLGSAVGIFWFVFTGGLSVLGVFYASIALPILGEIHTLWSGIVFVLIGAIIGLMLSKDSKVTAETDVPPKTFAYLFKGVSIAFENYKIGLGGLVRTINLSFAFGMIVFLPTYLQDVLGFTRDQWLSIYAFMWTVNIVFNLLSGVISDRWGWTNTVMWFGCVGSALSILLLYYIPTHFGVEGYTYTLLAAGALGACFAGFVPLSAIMPSLAPNDKGAAMSVLNLGAGLCAFVGPLIVTLFITPFGIEGIIWLFSGLYIVAAVLMKFVTLPAENPDESLKEHEQVYEVNKTH
ncbi:MFS transporter [Yersinia mollaretii]|uniref:MFS transporter n=1 Tax=Yersinia mollaretii TaxID=33060 RepID=A0AA44CLX3_YERMO|nr:MFS transporter [Yersinia mollaretii]CNL22501.1 Alpha-ketoglutarate permease [Yersinia enterocolitica]NIL23126.1 MFS transporter [Yersinia mollaretii]CNI79589.1 Alpha-ketoglutarate permease [Yersinia mollaretii]CNK15139.1 Alpha-ketoglutarate permease [Yersinia mollaretii]CQQ44174.1 Alpha-ketoglutarate permease [Yersinia mollaretii]